ncbi:N-acyl-D-amino-acid deacylase family protein [Geochorda subterranea]|uniref:D-aminoacylase n=1 Tax=Geochorda subterranea TaxID=3109564 RepID=A0ABZ1BNQ7_9FIRM|nr:D-aminoacylase [Limnochorda sp. LNt]WRP14470.1 D-aminoacylase [Limnochorda sp. LNt]
MTFDLIIADGLVVDGTGAPPRRADVGIVGDRIVAVADLSSANAIRRLDASGQIVAPGFIDMHTHSDLALLADGRAESTVRQGITTQVIGNCGLSPAPITNQVKEDVRKSLGIYDYGVEWTWESFGDYLQVLRQARFATHVVPLVGHGSIRSAAMGFDKRPPTADELETMHHLVTEAMEAGAFGMSTGLVYPPGMYSDTSELIELSKIVARYGGFYASHMRGEASTVVDSVREALQIGREAGVRVQISHHKAAGRVNWGRVRVTYSLIEEAARNLDVTYDIYPYTAGSANLSQLLPPWVHVGGTQAMLARLKDSELRPRIRYDVIHGTPDWPNFFPVDWKDIQIAHVGSERNRWMQGLTVQEVADQVGQDPVEFMMDLIVEEDNQVSMVNFVMSQDDVDFLIPKPQSMFGSDGWSITPGGPTGSGHPHPRCYGTFPRVLGHYVRERRLLSLEEAIHKMTGKASQKLGLSRRGEVREGYYADLVVFDPGTIADRATFANPHQFPVGVTWVLVDGQIAVDRCMASSVLNGKVLTPSR